MHAFVTPKYALALERTQKFLAKAEAELVYMSIFNYFKRLSVKPNNLKNKNITR